MQVLIERKDERWLVSIDKGGGGGGVIGVEFVSPVNAGAVADTIAEAMSRETGEAVPVVLR